jgi:transposase
MSQFTEAQLQELDGLRKRASKPYVRRWATALWNLAQGRSQREVADFMGASRASLLFWKRRYLTEGPAGLAVRKGRGRHRRAEPEEVEAALRQAPRNFGLPQTRWTLTSLAAVVPSLHGFSPSGVWRVLQRNNLSYKRGQPLLHSPDPDYVQKRGLTHSASRSPEKSAGHGPALY